jgi:hypothetical protein
VTERALPDLQPLVDELVASGAEVVWLGGSYARRDAGPYSDLDIGVIAAPERWRPREWRIHAGLLTSIVWTTAAATHASFRDPGMVGAAVPGWRSAVVLHDTDGIGAELVEAARSWTWDEVSAASDAWIGSQFMQVSEEVHKLLNAVDASHEVNAAIRRGIIAHRLALIMSVQRRILYDSERRLFDLVAEAMGHAWREAQTSALMSGDGATTAALTLYALAAAEVSDALTPDQLRVLQHTIGLLARFK